MRECMHCAPGARLSAKLRKQLESLSPEARAALVARRRDGCAALLVAARRGCAELAEYLVRVCGAPLEQTGQYRAPPDRASHRVTPLWCAAVAGHVNVVKVLLSCGAIVDACSDSGSTPARSACFMSHSEVVGLLLKRGADVQKANNHGGTCLINAVQSVSLCELLLSNGAEIDARDAELKTALHYAVGEHRADTARLLLRRGADPRAASRAGDTPLTAAALKGAAQLVSLLCASVAYSAPELADAYELLGCTQLDEFNDLHACLAAWSHATMLRHSSPLYVEKRPSPRARFLPPPAPLWAGPEWRDASELRAAAADARLLRRYALQVTRRVLGDAHRETQARIMYRGAWHLEGGEVGMEGAGGGAGLRYKECADLWKWVLRARIYFDTILHSESCDTACALTQLLLEAQAARGAQGGQGAGWRGPGFEDSLEVFVMLRDGFVEARAADCSARGAAHSERALRGLTHLVHLLAASAHSPAQHARMIEDVLLLVRGESSKTGIQSEDANRTGGSGESDGGSITTNGGSMGTNIIGEFTNTDGNGLGDGGSSGGLGAPRGALTQDSLLHASVSRLNQLNSTYRSHQDAIFPSLPVVKLLLSLGCDVRALNSTRSTPLHVAALPDNMGPGGHPGGPGVVDLLLAAGAHIDQPNAYGDTPLDLIKFNKYSTVKILQHITLACLAARALLKAKRGGAGGPGGPPLWASLPRTVRDFVCLHAPPEPMLW